MQKSDARKILTVIPGQHWSALGRSAKKQFQQGPGMVPGYQVPPWYLVPVPGTFQVLSICTAVYLLLYELPGTSYSLSAKTIESNRLHQKCLCCSHMKDYVA